MSIFDVLNYINKISLLVFFITLGFLGYQFYLFKKDVFNLKKENPIIPDFQENIDANINFTPLKKIEDKEEKILFEKRSPFFIYGGVLAIITFLIFLFLSFKTTSQNQKISFNQELSPTPTLYVNQYQSLTPTISQDQNITLTPTQEITPTEDIPTPTQDIPTPTQEIIIASPTTVEPTEIFFSPTSAPTSITQLPITGEFDKSILMFGSALLMILLALIF